MRESKFADRCFVAIVLVLMLGFMTGAAYALFEHEPRAMRAGLLLPVSR